MIYAANHFLKRRFLRVEALTQYYLEQSADLSGMGFLEKSVPKEHC